MYALLLCSCQTLSANNFIYIGHPNDLDQYRLYYDSDRRLFLLLDSNGCFYKSSDNSGTCLAFDHQSAEDFKQNVLSKMIEVNAKILEPKNKSEVLALLKQSKRPSIEKTMKLDFMVKPIKQININSQKEYHLVVNQYSLEASLIIMPAVNDSGKKDLKLFYSLTLPDATEKQKTSTRPFIIDPNYLLENMQVSAVEKAELLQHKSNREDKQLGATLYEYLENLGV
jgi:hypothetical protein